jgi:putative transcriptional regulator
VCHEGGIKRKANVQLPVYYGGPILNNVVGVLHSTEYRLASTNVTTASNIGFTLDSKILEDIAQGGGPLNRIVTLGMANWSASQLEEELEHPQSPAMSWLIMDYEEKLVFGQLVDTKPDDIWQDCLQRAVSNKTKEITSKVFKD